MKYDAFISYRHTELDMYVAKLIHKGLETYKPPRSIERIGGKKSITRVFRDQEELPIGSDLDDNILDALKESEFLIVICSPRTPQSHWVLKEIDSFIELHSRDHVLAVLIEGEPGESFPEQLLVDNNGNKVEPLAADVRGLNKSELKKKLKSELIRLAAPLLHCSYDNLRQRHRERKFKRMLIGIGATGAIVAGLGIGFGLYNAKMLKIINEHYQQKQITQSKYLAETSLNLLDEGDRRSATLVALAALPDDNNERPLVPEAQYALSQALGSYDIGTSYTLDSLLKHEVSITSYNLGCNGQYTTTIDSNNNVYVWDNSTSKIIHKENGILKSTGFPSQVYYANVYSDNLVIVSEDSVRVLSLDGDELFCEEKEDIRGVIDNPSTNELLLIGYDTSYVFNVETNTIGDTIKISDSSAMFSPSCSSISENGNYITFGYSTSDAETTIIEMYDRTTHKSVIKEIPLGYLSHTATGDDGTAFILCIDSAITEIIDDFTNHGHYHVVAVNSNFESDILWENDIEAPLGTAMMSKSAIRARTFVDDNQKETSCAVALFCNMLYTYDAATGSLLSSTGYSGNAEKLLLSKSGWAIVAEENGKINYFNTLSGYSSEELNVNSNKYTTDLQIQGNTMAIKSGSSPDITLMRTHQGLDCEELFPLDYNGELILSEDNQRYAILTSSYFDDMATLDFYDSKTNEKLSSFELEIELLPLVTGFFDNNQFLLINSDNETYIFNPDNNTFDKFKIGDSQYRPDNYAISDNYQYYAYIDSGNLYLYDFESNTNQKVSENMTFNTIPVVSNDGKNIYVASINEPLQKIFTDKEIGDNITVLADNLNLAKNISNCPPIQLSPDGNKIALLCNDNTLRIIDTSTGDINGEMNLQTFQNFYMLFSEDSNNLYIQGDDLIFKVYSVPQEEYIFVSTETFGNVQNIIEYDNFIALSSYTDLRLITKDTYSNEAVIDSGICYMPSSNKVYLNSGRTLYSFPYRSLDELKQRALELYGDNMFTELEKIKYHLE